MRVEPRSTRGIAATAKSSLDKENRADQGRMTISSKKARHRLSVTELARLEDLFGKETHPSRQQKKNLADELGMDYKTVTIWFQNKRQTSKRSQPPAEKADKKSGRTRANSCLRTVSSPSHNATLDAPEAFFESNGSEIESNATLTEAIVAIEPLIDASNASASRTRECPELGEATRKNEVPSVEDMSGNQTSENLIDSTSTSPDQPKGKSTRWKRMRTLEWACERQAKRRKLSRDGEHAKLGSDDFQDGDSNHARMNSALALLSLGTSLVQSRDVMKGASLLLGFKHSWGRK